jgi:hypothetical protein
MTDISKVKRNVAKMVGMNAPEADIDEYIASEGVTIDDVRNYKESAVTPTQAPNNLVNDVGNMVKEQSPAMAVGAKQAVDAAISGATPFKAVADIASSPEGQRVGVGYIQGKTLGWGAPLLRKMGIDVPEPNLKENVIGQAAAMLPPYSPLDVYKGGGLLLKMLKGAAMGAAYNPSDKEISGMGERVPGAVIGAAIPAAPAVIKGGASFVRKIAGVEPETVKQVLRVGMDRVADPAKREGAYFTNEIVPRVQDSAVKLLNEGGENAATFLKKNGVSEKAIAAYKKHGSKNIADSFEKYDQNLYELRDNIVKGIDEKNVIVENLYNKAYKNMKSKNMPLNETYKELRKILIDVNYINPDGTIKQITAFQQKNPVLTTLTKMYDDLLNNRQGLAIGKGEFPAIKEAISNLYREMPSNGYSQKIMDTLHKDAEKAGMTGLNTAKEAFKRLVEVREIATKYLNAGGENVLNRAGKLTTQEKKNLMTIQKFVGKKYPFVDEISKLNAAREIGDTFNRFSNPVEIEKQLKKLAQYKSPAGAEIKGLEDVLSHLPDKEITKDAIAHYLAKDLNQETLSAGFMGVPAAIRSGTEALVRAYLKYNPKIRKMMSTGAGN